MKSLRQRIEPEAVIRRVGHGPLFGDRYKVTVEGYRYGYTVTLWGARRYARRLKRKAATHGQLVETL